MRVLTISEKADLEAKLKKTKDLSEWKRIFAVLGYDDGQSIQELAETLRLSPFTVEDYLKEYNSHDKTKNDPRGGSSSKLTVNESEKLEQHLSQKTYLKVKDIVAYTEAQFGKKYSRSGMTAWLITHDFAYKQPQKVPGKLSPEAQQKFIQEYEKLKATLQLGDELYFVDAVHPEHQSQAVCGWIKKGECKTLQTSGKQLRLHFAGALSLEGMKIVISEYETVDADAMLDFFRKLENQSKAQTIHVVLDNARANKNKKLAEFMKDSRIKLHYLPPYSPNLNAIERLWKIMRESTLYNRYYESCTNCFAAIRGFFTEKLPEMGDVLKSRINDNFQVIRLNPVNLA
jgi:transposase